MTTEAPRPHLLHHHPTTEYTPVHPTLTTEKQDGWINNLIKFMSTKFKLQAKCQLRNFLIMSLNAFTQQKYIDPDAVMRSPHSTSS